MMKKIGTLLLIQLLFIAQVSAQQSIARQWNEELLSAIRIDFARPTVHARNLFHLSVVMYDVWAAYDEVAEPFLLGRRLRGIYPPEFLDPNEFPEFNRNDLPIPTNIEAAREEAISYAAFRLLMHRFENSPNFDISLPAFEAKFTSLGYDPNFTSTDYTTGNPAAFGNYMAKWMIEFGHLDGANEHLMIDGEEVPYGNEYYEPINQSLIVEEPGNPRLTNPNRWQPLTLELFIDQSGQVIEGKTPDFLSPEWGAVVPFALNYEDLKIIERDGYGYWVYHDPGKPPMLDFDGEEAYFPDEYKWTFSLNAIWSSHLDPTDGVMWDVSPASIGNIDLNSFPETFEEYHDFYNLLDGGDPSTGYDVNPVTGEPYEPQIVPRGDYTRILAEFWADGPASETPPGHWFTILNYVNDHPLLEKRFKGQGEILDDLEWDVKAYLTLGGAVHDAAISAWGIKGYYDYIRPVCALRYMADHGQSTSEALPHYDPHGIPLVPGYVELVEEGDPLAGASNENVDKIKILAWKGPEYIDDPDVDDAGVDWILAENWWPYQRPTFITPPFAGYISGHSTYSRAGAEVMTLLTGDEYFPGGMGVFPAPQNEFLVFEEGPSVDVTLQWAKYQDASDQCSLSRIWGGIHPPADDIPGRKIGHDIGIAAFGKAEKYFEGVVTGIEDFEPQINEKYVVFPNPVASGSDLNIRMKVTRKIERVQIVNTLGQILVDQALSEPMLDFSVNTKGLAPGVYSLKVIGKNWSQGSQLLVGR